MSALARASVGSAFRAGAPARRARAQPQLVCSAAPREQGAAASDRRSFLLGLAGAVVAAPLVAAAPASARDTQTLPVQSLTILQRKSILADVQKRAEAELAKVLTPADQAASMRLLLADAGTYDVVTKTGGCDGSIVLPEELGRPENKGLAPIVEKLRKARDAYNAAKPEGQDPISWADTIVLAAKVTTEQNWRADKIAKANDAARGAKLADFGSPIRISIGRVDAKEPVAAGRVPAPDAPLAEVQQFFNKLGAKPGKSGKVPFWERQQFLLWPSIQEDGAAVEAAMVAFSPESYQPWKKQYDTSRRTVTRTSYEVDFGELLAKLAGQGAKYNDLQYLVPIEYEVKRL